MTLLPHVLSKEIPPKLRMHIYLMCFLSPYVIIEPAPFDLFFIYTLLLSVLFKWLYIPKALGFPMILMFLYTALSLPGLMIVDKFSHSLVYFAITTYLIVLSFFIASLIVMYRGMIELITDALIFGMLVSVFIGLVFKFVSINAYMSLVVSLVPPRFYAFFKDPNVFGPAACCISVLLMNRITHQRDKRLIGTACLAVLAFSVLISYSRAAWGLFIIMFAIFCGPIVLEQVKSMRLVRLVMIMFLSIVALAVIFIIAQKMGYLDLVKSRLSLQRYDNTRFANHKLLFNLALDAPFGHGPKTAVLVGQAHSSYIRIFYENGIFAFFLYQLFMLYCLWVAFRMTLVRWKYKYHALACLAAHIGFIANGFTIDTFHWRHMYIFCGLILGLNLVFKKLLYENPQQSYYVPPPLNNNI